MFLQKGLQYNENYTKKLQHSSSREVWLFFFLFLCMESNDFYVISLCYSNKAPFHTYLLSISLGV